MIPEPLHPAIVHFPIVLSVLLPLAAIAAWLLTRRGNSVRKSWTPVVVLAALLSASAWAAVRTGEAEEEVVEEIVAEAAIHAHEEAAELFLPLSIAVLLLAAAGLTQRRFGQATRGLATLASIALLAAAFRVGHSGGELVYEHGAAAAYAAAPTSAGASDLDDREDRPATRVNRGHIEEGG